MVYVVECMAVGGWIECARFNDYDSAMAYVLRRRVWFPWAEFQIVQGRKVANAV